MEGKLLRVLAIETSCDETSASVISGIDYPAIKTNIIASQIDIHKLTGGVVPEVAARAHCEQIIPVIEQSLAPLEIKLFGKKSNQTIHKVLPHIDAIAVTVGPGLVGSLLVGVETAKALAFATGKPLIPINHLEGHIFAALAANNFQFSIFNFQSNPNNQFLKSASLFPALALIVSGGHTELVLIKDMFDYEVVGETLDDAAGEAFDKVGTLLGLEYPCGQKVAELAEKYFNQNQKSKIKNQNLSREEPRDDKEKLKKKLPRPMLHSGDLNFSFSGLKTAVVNLVRQLESKPANRPTHLRGVATGLKEEIKQAIAYEFQEAVVEVLLEKTTKAFQMNNSELIINNSKKKIINYKLLTINSILLTGGVSANKRLREVFQERFGDKLLISPLELCGDNAGMIGIAAFYRYKKQIFNFQFSIFNKFSNSNDQKNILKSKIFNLKSAFPWQSVDVDPNLEL